MREAYENMKVRIPKGQEGIYSIRKFTVSEAAASLERMRLFNPSSMGRAVSAGTYTGLYRKGGWQGETLMMSDTRDEMRDHSYAVHKAMGHCLVAGLGIGMVVRAALMKPEVTKVTVVEVAPEIIKLVAPHLYKEFGTERLEVIEGSIFDFDFARCMISNRCAACGHVWDAHAGTNLGGKASGGDCVKCTCVEFTKRKPIPGKRYGMVWFDIWDDICSDNLEQMAVLHRRVARRADWYGSWAHGQCVRQREMYG